MEELINLLHTGGYSCVIDNEGKIRTFTQRGVADLYDLLTREPEFLKGALIADKVVGKGAAALSRKFPAKSRRKLPQKSRCR